MDHNINVIDSMCKISQLSGIYIINLNMQDMQNMIRKFNCLIIVLKIIVVNNRSFETFKLPICTGKPKAKFKL